VVLAIKEEEKEEFYHFGSANLPLHQAKAV